MNRLIVAPAARNDLTDIYVYVARDSVSAAANLHSRLLDKFTLLASHPLLGQSEAELSPNLRSFSLGNYVIYFYPLSDGVEIARVLHGARDATEQF